MLTHLLLNDLTYKDLQRRPQPAKVSRKKSKTTENCGTPTWSVVIILWTPANVSVRTTALNNLSVRNGRIVMFGSPAMQKGNMRR
jgi:2-keto-4-pentenoate hydratase/2-oxohepta-3-ene-1,7-dioic acid hydratase in catechol pathway